VSPGIGDFTEIWLFEVLPWSEGSLDAMLAGATLVRLGGVALAYCEHEECKNETF
jgi:hypothetical protein